MEEIRINSRILAAQSGNDVRMDAAFNAIDARVDGVSNVLGGEAGRVTSPGFEETRLDVEPGDPLDLSFDGKKAIELESDSTVQSEGTIKGVRTSPLLPSVFLS